MPTPPPPSKTGAPKPGLDARVSSYLDRALEALDSGRPDEAEGFEKLALEAAEKLGKKLTRERAAVMRVRAQREAVGGDAAKAFNLYQRAVDDHKKLSLEGRETYELIYDAAIAARDAGETESALKLFGEAIELSQSLFGGAELPSVPARVGLAYSLIGLGRLKEAEKTLEYALKVTERSGSAGQRTSALVHEALAAVRSHAGESTDEDLDEAASEMEAAERQRMGREKDTKQERLSEELEVIEGPEEAETPEEVLADLDENLVGLEPIKKQFQRLANLLRVQGKRRELGKAAHERRFHVLFIGPPGTGKTTVAGYLGRLCRSVGLLERSDVVSVTRAQLVRGHVGQTAIRTNEVVDFALDKVLFVDEAYSLAPKEAGNDFGPEAIAELMVRMERDGHRLVVAAAGYPAEMKNFLESNSGFASRFTDTLEFSHYEADELVEIFEGFCERGEYQLAEGALDAVQAWAKEQLTEADETFGNGRAVRNLFEAAIGAQADRIVAMDKLDDPEALLELRAEDINSALA